MPRGSSASSASTSHPGKRQGQGSANGHNSSTKRSGGGRSRSNTASALPLTNANGNVGGGGCGGGGGGGGGGAGSGSAASAAVHHINATSTAIPQLHDAFSTGPTTQFHTTGGWGNGRIQPRWYDDDDYADSGSAEHIDVGKGASSGGDVSAAVANSGSSPTTVLANFPLLDTITLLIIFLQLPSTVLTIVHFLYALQTFVPPTTTLLSASNPTGMPSFSNLLLQGNNGSPSLLTILFADIVVALISMFLWPSARTVLIDFAQAVIAISFGSGESGSGAKNAAVCAGVMSGIKVIQGRFKFDDAAGGVFDSLHPTGTSNSGSPSSHAHRISKLFSGRSQSVSWIRNAIAIHIVAQWGMQVLRRWLIKLPESSSSASSSGTDSGHASSTAATGKANAKDPEAAAGAPLLERENSIVGGGGGGGGGKRKKKHQAQSIRNNQPMWATIANMVVHLAKEIERSRVSTEAAGEGSSSGGVEGVANVGIVTTAPEQVWITRIGSNDIGFIATCAGGASSPETTTTSGIPGVSVQTSHSAKHHQREQAPFFVRVNHIVWPQADIYRKTPASSEEDGQDHDDDTHPASSPENVSGPEEWAVDVTGLTGSTEYDFEFVSPVNGRIFYTTSACTAPTAQASEYPNSTHAPPTPQRPLSPITTLLHSLTLARSCLSDSRSTLKSARKSHKSALSDLRRDIEKTRSLLLSNDRGEERAFRRNLALRENVKRAEEETEVMLAELERVDAEPDRLRPIWEARKREWERERKELKKKAEKWVEVKREEDRKALEAEGELGVLEGKKERLCAKREKLRKEMERLEGMVKELEERGGKEEERKRRESEREEREDERRKVEQQFMEIVEGYEKRVVELREGARENWEAVWRGKEESGEGFGVVGGGMGVTAPPGFSSPTPVGNGQHQQQGMMMRMQSM